MSKKRQLEKMRKTTTSKERVAISSSVGRKLRITSGARTQVVADEHSAQIILNPITREYIHSFRGCFRGKGLLQELIAEKERAKAL